MTYEIVFTKRAVKDLEKLEQQVKERIISKLKEFKDVPLNHAKKLTQPKLGSFRFKIDNYRIIFDFGDDKIIIILRVGHRKTIYK